jgi:PAS domain S-box-containing protein
MKGIFNILLPFLIGAVVLSLFSTLQKVIVAYPIVWPGYVVPAGVGGAFGLIIGMWRLKSKKDAEKAEHLNLVLRTIRSINQLLAKEKDRTKLLQGVCNTLIANRGYYNSWIALLDKTGALTATAEVGLGEGFLKVVERLEQGELTQCAERALMEPEIVLTKDPFLTCMDCPLSEKYAGRSAMTVRLERRGKIYGLLCVSAPAVIAMGEEDLLQEIADEISLALYNIEIEKERKGSEEALQRSLSQLGERVKELNCLFSLSNLVEKRDYSLDDILQGAVELLPPAWQYPEITCAGIILDDKEFRTKNFRDAEWTLEFDIAVHGESTGVVKIGYLEEKPDCDEGPFLKEEKSLLRAVAERLGRVVERKVAQDMLQRSEKRFRRLVENSLIGISIIQDGQVVYQNREQERLLGPLPRPIILDDVDRIHPDDIEKVKNLSDSLKSRGIKPLDIDFRFVPTQNKDSLSEMLWVNCRASQFDFRGRDAILVNMMDVTQTKKLEHLLTVQDKMASLGRVAAGIAHEIRNPLSGINIYINTLQKLYGRGGEEQKEKIKEIFQHVKSASAKIESVIRRVMDFSKPSEPKFISADINQPIEEAIKLTAVTMRKSGIQVDTALKQGLPKCRFDPQLMEEVILNLMNNAVDAMKDISGKKKIQVISSARENQVAIRILDSGPGIPVNFREMIFDPFYTTKQDSTGIGLSLCHRIISDHDGAIHIETGKFGGAEFIIEIPIITSAD